MKAYTCGIIAMLSCFILSVQAQVQREPATLPQAEQAAKLKFVVVINRHGVRSPTGKVDQLNQYSAQPWPKWSVPPGYLTERGAMLMRLFGAYDRELFRSQGILHGNGCEDAGKITIIADSDQRTRESGKALAAGLLPDCPIDVHALAEGTHDPLFHFTPRLGDADRLLASAAVAGRIGNDPAGLVDAYRTQLEELEGVLTGCDIGMPCSTTSSVARKSLFDIPSSIGPGNGDHLTELRSPLGTASTMAENLLLEYTEGMEMAQVGWGRVDEKKLRELMQLHTASSDIERRTDYIARVQSSNMLAHILDSMRQAIVQKPVAGALGRPNDGLLVLVGHDTNLANISGALGLSWLIDGRRDDTPPGGALVLELRQRWDNATYEVSAYYTAQTLTQMRNATPLNLEKAPARASVFIPGCSRADIRFSCNWEDFQRVLTTAIDPAFAK